jgi:predicted DNA-binding transcriptional regulator AlpA
MTTEQNIIQTDDQLLRIDDVAALTTLSKSCINLWVAQDRFPKPCSPSKTIKIWRYGDIRKWSNSMFPKTENSHG